MAENVEYDTHNHGIDGRHKSVIVTTRRVIEPTVELTPIKKSSLKAIPNRDNSNEDASSTEKKKVRIVNHEDVNGYQPDYNFNHLTLPKVTYQ